MCPQTLDLFDDTDATTEARHFQVAFDAWLTHQRTSVARKLTLASSIKAYTVLWQAFAEWCLSQSPVVALDTLTEADLNAFINSRLAATPSSQPKLSRLKEAGKFTPRHAWRLLTLIDGVLGVRAESAGSPAPNRCAADLLQSREDWLYANANRRATLPNYLEPAEARILVNYLSAGLPRSGRRGADVSWQELRNRCAVALHLGSGLTPADVRVLQLSSTRVRAGDEKGVPGTVHVPAHGDSQAVEFAYEVEQSAPGEWDAIARYELAWYERKRAYDQAVREQRLRPDEVPSNFGTTDPPNLPADVRFAELLASHPL